MGGLSAPDFYMDFLSSSPAPAGLFCVSQLNPDVCLQTHPHQVMTAANGPGAPRWGTPASLAPTSFSIGSTLMQMSVTLSDSCSSSSPPFTYSSLTLLFLKYILIVLLPDFKALIESIAFRLKFKFL